MFVVNLIYLRYNCAEKKGGVLWRDLIFMLIKQTII